VKSAGYFRYLHHVTRSYYSDSFGGSLTMPNRHVSIFLHKKRKLNVLNLAFWKGNQMSFCSHGSSLAPPQCNWKRRISHSLWLLDSVLDVQRHGHPKYNRPIFLDSYICGVETVFLLLRLAFFFHEVSNFLSTSTPVTAFTTPKYAKWFVTLQFPEWNVSLRKFGIIFFLLANSNLRQIR